jgi:hypothetical protein
MILRAMEQRLYAAREDATVFSATVGVKREQFDLLDENPMGERIITSPVPQVSVAAEVTRLKSEKQWQVRASSRRLLQ